MNAKIEEGVSCFSPASFPPIAGILPPFPPTGQLDEMGEWGRVYTPDLLVDGGGGARRRRGGRVKRKTGERLVGGRGGEGKRRSTRETPEG